MSGTDAYVLDADSFIRSKREHYSPDFCPGFWDALLQQYDAGYVGSIVPVRQELLKGKDALADWIKNDVPDGFFEEVKDQDVHDACADVIQWVEANEQYNRAAKNKFASGADPWLIAFAKAKQRTLVTYEVSSPESEKFVKIPDVTSHFKVTSIPPFVMLRRLGVRLVLRA